MVDQFLLILFMFIYIGETKTNMADLRLFQGEFVIYFTDKFWRSLSCEKKIYETKIVRVLQISYEPLFHVQKMIPVSERMAYLVPPLVK